MKAGTLVLLLAALGLTTFTGNATPTISVGTALAPNAFGSPSYDPWVNNAIYAMQNHLSSYGWPGPAQFNLVTGPIDLPIVTGFPSWLQQANPGATFGAGYANELGNRAHFPLYIDGNGTKISISELSFVGMSSDPGDVLGFSYGRGEYNYSSSYVGIIRNPDNTVTYVTSGPNTQEVDAIVGRGSGNALDIYTTDPGTTQQDKINNARNKFGLDNGPLTFTGTYTLDLGTGPVSGSATFDYNGVPDGGMTITLLGVSIMGLGLIRRRMS